MDVIFSLVQLVLKEDENTNSAQLFDLILFKNSNPSQDDFFLKDQENDSNDSIQLLTEYLDKLASRSRLLKNQAIDYLAEKSVGSNHQSCKIS